MELLKYKIAKDSSGFAPENRWGIMNATKLPSCKSSHRTMVKNIGEQFLKIIFLMYHYFLVSLIIKNHSLAKKKFKKKVYTCDEPFTWNLLHLLIELFFHYSLVKIFVIGYLQKSKAKKRSSLVSKNWPGENFFITHPPT